MAFPLPCPLRGRVPTIAQALSHFGVHGRPSPIPSSACIGHRWKAFSGCFFMPLQEKSPWAMACHMPQSMGIFSIGVSGKYTLTRSWLLLRRRILLLVRFLSHTGSDFLSQRPCYGNADWIAESAFPYSVFSRLPARKNGQQSFYPLLPVHELTKACAFRLVNLYRWLTCSFCF